MHLKPIGFLGPPETCAGDLRIRELSSCLCVVVVVFGGRCLCYVFACGAHPKLRSEMGNSVNLRPMFEMGNTVHLGLGLTLAIVLPDPNFASGSTLPQDVC